MLNTTEAITEVCMKSKKNRSYSTVPVPADRDNTLWSVRSVFINDNIKTFGEEGELRLNIIFSIPDLFIVSAHRTEFITDSHFEPIEEAKTGGLMKKILCAILILTLFMAEAVTVYAAGPQEPTIEAQMPDCYGIVGESAIMLFTNAASPDGGTLEYQWYSTTVNDIATIQAIDNETGTTFVPPQQVGVVYYCYAVWNIKSDTRSSPVYSRLIRVEYTENEPTVVSIEILSTPDKVVYTSGECLDLTGLKVRIWTSEGYIDSVNGDKLEITKNPLITVGEQKIKVAYGDAFDIFIVTVKAAPHTHSFGEWMVTTKPSCTDPGIQTRECDCGQTERAEIPATGHQWDEGKVTKEPTETFDGERTFTCTVCKATKTEVIKAGEIVSEPAEDTNPTESSESTISTGESEASGSQQPGDTETSSGFPWWIIAVISAVLVIGGGAVTAWVIIQKREKTTGE